MVEAGKGAVCSAWLAAQADKEAAKDVLPPGERFGQVIGFILGGIFIAFLAIHETRPTGFFTEDFGRGDAALLYFAIVLGMIASLVRIVTGRKNLGRPIDAFGMVYMFIVSIYFLATFPFDFSHFADPLPRALEPLLDWISAGLAKWLIGIGIVVSPVFVVFNLAMYNAVRKRLKGTGVTVPEKSEEKPKE